MTTERLSFESLPNLAVAAGASTPAGGIAGAMLWSTSAAAPLVWTGSVWAAIGGGGGGGFTHTFVTATPAANQLAWTIAGRTAYTTVRATPTDNAFIGGVAGGAGGDVLTIVNASTGLLWLINEDAADTAANRIILPSAAFIIMPGQSATLNYDATSARWRLVGKSRDVNDIDGKLLLVMPSTGTAVVSDGLGATLNTATLSTIAPTATPTDSFAEDAATQITNATAAGSSDVRGNGLNWMRGATSGRQGILFQARVRFTALGATGSVAAMMTNSTAAITTQARATNNTFGLGAHGGETTLRVWSRDGAAATAVDLGANFPVPSATAAYDMYMFAPSATAAIRYMVRRLDSDQRAQGSITANLPANTLGLAPRVGIMVGATATASTLQFARFGCRSAS